MTEPRPEPRHNGGRVNSRLQGFPPLGDTRSLGSGGGSRTERLLSGTRLESPLFVRYLSTTKGKQRRNDAGRSEHRRRVYARNIEKTLAHLEALQEGRV